MKHTLLIFMLALQLAFYPLLVVAANDEDFDPNFLISDEEKKEKIAVYQDHLEEKLQNWKSLMRL